MSKILIIDDDPLVRSVIARVLRLEGHDLLVAVDGRRGVELFQSEHPELVITDIIMPEKEGLETIREIRAISPEAKIIAMSGGGRIGNADILAIAAEFGAREILGKPFEPSELTDSVQRCLGAAS
jgi:two-component system, chemotaxis family, chemotaxis protein CheY